jgi:hypothetical protein
VRVQEGLAQRVEATDPHLRGREGVHPGDHADAVVVGVGLEHQAADRCGVRQRRLGNDLGRDLLGGGEGVGDLGGLVAHLQQNVVAVEALTARQEPDLLAHLVLPCP